MDIYVACTGIWFFFGAIIRICAVCFAEDDTFEKQLFGAMEETRALTALWTVPRLGYAICALLYFLLKGL